jgi:hypothetical protein
MSAAGKLIGRAEEGNLDEIGACLAAIRSMSTHNGVIDEEDARAIYSLTCIALVEWRKLDAEADKPRK